MTGKLGMGARVLQNMVNARSTTSLDALDEGLVDIPRKRITAILCRLISDGYVVRHSAGSYQVTKAGVEADKKGYKPGPQRKATGRAKPQPASLRQKVWQTLRMRRKVATPDLLANVCDGDPNVQRGGVYKYLKALERAGYVQSLAKRAPGTAPSSNGFKIVLLLKDTGAVAPMVNWRDHRLTDLNTDEVIDFSEVAA